MILWCVTNSSTGLRAPFLLVLDLAYSLISQCEGSVILKASGVGFIDSVTRLIALLLDYRSVPANDANRGRRMGCMLNLLVSPEGREGRGVGWG